MARKKKTDRIWRLLIICIGASIVVMLVLWVYELVMARKATYVRYAEFGIDIPLNFSVHGIRRVQIPANNQLAQREVDGG